MITGGGWDTKDVVCPRHLFIKDFKDEESPGDLSGFFVGVEEWDCSAVAAGLLLVGLGWARILGSLNSSDP